MTRHASITQLETGFNGIRTQGLVLMVGEVTLGSMYATNGLLLLLYPTQDGSNFAIYEDF